MLETVDQFIERPGADGLPYKFSDAQAAEGMAAPAAQREPFFLQDVHIRALCAFLARPTLCIMF